MTASKLTVRPTAPAAAGSGRMAELALVERVRRGELGAFEELYRAHAALKLEEFHDRALAPLNPVTTADEYRARFAAARGRHGHPLDAPQASTGARR